MDYVTSSSLKAVQTQKESSSNSLSLLIMPNSTEGNLCASIESLEIDQNENLDYLLECYLDLLDQYTKLRSQLSQHLSAGFLSLAQANFQSPNHARYGQDFYDDRMQASTLVSLKSTDSFSKIGFTLLHRRNSLSISSECEASVVKSSPLDLTSSPHSPSHAPPPEADSASAKLTAESSPEFSPSADSKLAHQTYVELHTEPCPKICSESPPGPSSERMSNTPSQAEFETPLLGRATSKETTSSASSCDPLNWFGILVPSALRRTQSSFKAVVEEIVPRIATMDREMRQVEIEVRRVRKKMLQAEKRAAKAATAEF